MKKALALLACLPLAAFAGPESWSAIQSVGGISVGPPFHSPDGWLLVIHANISGLEAQTRQPIAANSALACKRTNAVVEGMNIYLTVISGVAAYKVGAVCPSAKLGNIEPGTYKVFYRGPDEKPVLLQEVPIGL
jgi:hypothetical protein